MNPRRRSRTTFAGALLLLCLVVDFSIDSGGVSAQPNEPKKKGGKNAPSPAPDDVNDLSMEVNALRTLYLLKGSDSDESVGNQNPEARLHAIKNTCAMCAQKEKQREKAEVSEGYRKLLVDLRTALIEEQEERIEELDKKLQELQAKEDPDIDDRVEISDEARRKAGSFVRVLCTADQVVAYLAAYGKDLPNPRTLLFKTMRVNPQGAKSDKASAEEWKVIRASVVREVTWQIGGLNIEKGDQVGSQVEQLLDKAYAMSEEDLKINAPKLRGEVGAIVNRVGPTDLLKHVIEQDVAELLSNPRLIPAVEARLKFLRKK